jgi:hypothetical protein
LVYIFRFEYCLINKKKKNRVSEISGGIKPTTMVWQNPPSPSGMNLLVSFVGTT